MALSGVLSKQKMVKQPATRRLASAARSVSGCAAKNQIAGLNGITRNDPTKAPGYDRLSPESQEQIRLAFEKGKPVKKDFKGIRQDLAKDTRRYAKEYTDVSFYKVDVAGCACACCGGDCLAKNVKITKGELRLGLSVPFDGEHESMVYKHWQCMSTIDLEKVLIRAGEDSIGGIDSLPAVFEEVVAKTFETGKIVEPPEHTIKPPKKPKKPRTKKSAVEQERKEEAVEATEATIKVEEPEHELDVKPNDAAPSPPLLAQRVSDTRCKAKEVADVLEATRHEPVEVVSAGVKTEEAEGDGVVKGEGAPAPALKSKAKKSRAKKRPIKEVDASSEKEPEHVPKKSRSRSRELLAWYIQKSYTSQRGCDGGDIIRRMIW
ncbi:hypothetical protein G6011_07259 [Alternaria panax]|uniref:PARP-type domain-containing protein n=1 Tax=Alternaria panax TaxID=48097 RepID=A0AAD4FBT8_9PLEO|nr:hypothetical protein G6011_07259 [Alternaria panax]